VQGYRYGAWRVSRQKSIGAGFHPLFRIVHRSDWRVCDRGVDMLPDPDTAIQSTTAPRM
jgi:hypothetical protein